MENHVERNMEHEVETAILGLGSGLGEDWDPKMENQRERAWT